MGFFGGYVFDGSSWREFDPQDGQVPAVTATWLSVCVYDSDIAEVRYEPAGPGSGTAFLGFTPRAYYEDESASAPADVAREAAGLASWVARQQGRADEAELRQVITPFIADDTPESLDDLDADDDDAELDEADIFVEAKVSRFLKAVGLPVRQACPATRSSRYAPAANKPSISRPCSQCASRRRHAHRTVGRGRRSGRRPLPRVIGARLGNARTSAVMDDD